MNSCRPTFWINFNSWVTRSQFFFFQSHVVNSNRKPNVCRLCAWSKSFGADTVAHWCRVQRRRFCVYVCEEEGMAAGDGVTCVISVKICLCIFVLPLSTSCSLLNWYDKSYKGWHRLINVAGSYKFIEVSVQLDIPMSVQLPTGHFFFFNHLVLWSVYQVCDLTLPALHLLSYRTDSWKPGSNENCDAL